MTSNRLDGDDLGPSQERRAFKHLLMERMTQQKISAAELARKAGVSKDAISSYTTMRSLPSEETLAKLAKALKCRPSALINADGEGSVSADPSTVVEIREYSKPGYKLLIARVPVPIDAVTELFEQLMAYANKRHKK